jgi:hypothetical protein
MARLNISAADVCVRVTLQVLIDLPQKLDLLLFHNLGLPLISREQGAYQA